MARDPHGRIVRGEAAAFEKLTAAVRHAEEACRGLARRLTSADLQRLTAALRHCIEAATEISTWRSDGRWFQLTMMFEKLLATASRVQLQTAGAGGSSVPRERWTAMASRFRGIGKACESLWSEAERGGVQGALLS